MVVYNILWPADIMHSNIIHTQSLSELNILGPNKNVFCMFIDNNDDDINDNIDNKKYNYLRHKCSLKV
jgi:hypothetical protein